MAERRLDTVLHCIQQLGDARVGAELTDGQLLRRFVAGRDEAAFAALVRRHGGLVLGVCRRVLPRVQDAEDAFQATFLVLARKAAAVRRLESLASWLHGVAHRTALNARKSAMRRQRREQTADRRQAESPAAAASLKELQAILDEEVQRLPERYRAPFVLCCLEAKSRPEAAQALGVREGTVSSRLARARALLQARLTRRGVALTAALCAAALSQQVAPASALAGGAVKAALGSAAPEAVVALTEGVLQTMFVSKVKRVTLVLVALCLLTVGAGLAATQHQRGAQDAEGGTEDVAFRAPRPALRAPDEPLPREARARLGTLRLRFSPTSIDAVVALSPDLKLLAWVGTDARLHVWETAAAKELWQTPYPEAPVPARNYSCEGVVFSPDGKVLAGTGARLRLWDSATGKELWHSEEYQSGCGFAAFSPDGKTVAVYDHAGTTAHLWDVAGGTRTASWDDPALVRSLTFSPDGKTLAVAALNEPVRLRDVATGKTVARLGPDDLHTHRVEFSPDGKVLAAWCYDRTVRFWDVKTGREVRTMDKAAYLALSPDGRTLAWCDDDSGNVIHLGAADTGKEFAQLRPRGAVRLTRFAADGKTVAAVAPGDLRLWDVATRKEVVSHHFPGPASAVGCLVFAPDGKAIAAAAAYLTDPAYVWDASGGKLLHQFQPEGELYAAGFAAGGRPLVVGTEGDRFHLWDAGSGKKLFRLAPDDGRYGYSAAAVSPDGKLVAVQRVNNRGAHALQVWDAATGEEVWKVKGEKCAVFHSFAFSADGKTLAGTNQCSLSVYRWDAATGKKLAALSAPHRPAETADQGLFGLALSADGRLIAAQTTIDGTVRVFGATEGREVTEIASNGEREPALAFSPDGRVLAVTEGKVIRLIELATGQERHRFTGHERRVHALAFSPDGRTLASGSQDTTILLWDVSGRGDRPSAAPTPAELGALWDDLSEAAPRAYRAMRTLQALPAGDVAALLGKRLQALDSPAARIARLVKDLDADEFDVREKATAELASLGKAAGPPLREVLRGEPSAEVRRRVEELLARLGDANGAPLASGDLTVTRAVEVLERAGTPEARAVLEKLSRGAAEDRRTLEAKAALRRLK